MEVCPSYALPRGKSLSVSNIYLDKPYEFEKICGMIAAPVYDVDFAKTPLA